MSLFVELDTVMAKVDITSNIPKGTIGVVHQLDETEGRTIYLVEFIKQDKMEIIDIVTVDEQDLSHVSFNSNTQ